VVRGGVPPVRTLFSDDGRSDTARRLAFFDVSAKLILPRSVASNACRVWALKFDQQRVSVRVVVESTLDVEPLCELLARDGVIDLVDEVLDPCFDRTVHLVVLGARIVEHFPEATARSYVRSLLLELNRTESN